MSRTSNTCRRQVARCTGARRGFTLVEMLVVIIIIGLLTSLLTMAVLSAMRSGRESKVLLETNQLDLAIKSFKEKYGAYPWGEGTIRENNTLPAQPDYEHEDSPYSATPTASSRRARIMGFLAKAFPQYTADQDVAAPAGCEPYVNFRYVMGRATLFHYSGTPPTVDLPVFTLAFADPANNPDFTPATRNCCDIETLDAAEIWVLCVGGIPRRRLDSQGKTVFEMTGFSTLPQLPFLFPVSPQDLATPMLNGSWQAAASGRTPSLFSFPSNRLTDYDADGWPEFVPDLPSSGVPVAPYVYFESETYNYRPMYPFRSTAAPWTAPGNDPNTTAVDELTLIGQWGLAKPYATDCTSGTAASPWTWITEWVQPTGFQLICAGADGIYGGAPAGLLMGDQDAEDTQVVRVSSIGQRRESGQPTPNRPMHAADADNLTSFSTGQLQDGYKKR